MIEKVQYHILRDYRPKSPLTDDDIVLRAENDPELRSQFVAFTCLLAHPGDGKLYCGLTALDTDILYRFDPQSKRFESLHYSGISEPYEVKIHRSLELAGDETVYGATACLHQVNRRWQAPGGSLFRIPPGSDYPEKIAVPLEQDYIQTISLDGRRNLVYGQSYPVFRFFRYDLVANQVRDFGYVGSITHISALDDQGCFWGTWDPNNHHLYKYDPVADEIVWYDHGVPGAKEDANRMYAGAGPVDCMINGGDGYLYIGTCGGNLCRLDPRTAEVKYLGRPAPTKRLPGLVVWRDSLLLGCAGDEEGSNLFAYDRETNAFHHLGSIQDQQTGLKLYRVHDLAMTDEKTAYIAETDVPTRSGYLWECTVSM